MLEHAQFPAENSICICIRRKTEITKFLRSAAGTSVLFLMSDVRLKRGGIFRLCVQFLRSISIIAMFENFLFYLVMHLSLIYCFLLISLIFPLLPPFSSPPSPFSLSYSSFYFFEFRFSRYSKEIRLPASALNIHSITVYAQLNSLNSYK